MANPFPLVCSSGFPHDSHVVALHAYCRAAGIGKSVFRYYLLHRLCEKHVSNHEAFSVIMQAAPDEVGLQPGAGSSTLLRFGADGSFSSEQSPSSRLPTAWKQQLISPNCPAYYITDGLPPDVSQLDPKKVRILEVSSPLEKRWKHFTNGLAAGVVDTRYMPLAPLAEMQHMREHVATLLTSSEVRARYEKLGGSIRGVLVRNRISAEAIIQTALAHAKSLDAVMASSTTSGELEGSGIAHIPSTLVHFRVVEEESAEELVDAHCNLVQSPLVADPFSIYEAVFASNYIRHQLLAKFHSRFVVLLSELVNTADLPYTSVLKGNLYEEFVHQRMQGAAAAPCEIRSLEPGVVAAAAPLNLSGKPLVEFDGEVELAGLQLQEGHLYKPISKSFGAVDFVLGLDVVGNMTLNLRHGISISALLRVVQAMRFQPVADGETPRVLRFLWLLPSRNLFHRMKKQPLSYRGRVIPPFAASAAAASSSTPARTAAQQKLLELEQRVQLQQFAVFMPPSPLGGTMSEEKEEEEVLVHGMDVDGEVQYAAVAAADASSDAATSGSGRKRKKK